MSPVRDWYIGTAGQGRRGARDVDSRCVEAWRGQRVRFEAGGGLMFGRDMTVAKK